MGQKQQVMVVDDDPAMCEFLRTFLAARGLDVVTVTSADDAVRRFPAVRPAAVLLDVVMPGRMDGLAALAAFRKIDADAPVVVVSGQGGTATVVQAIKLGATDYICKPFQDAELEVVLGNALKQRQLTPEVASLRARLNEQSRYTMLFGNSQRMTEVRELIERVADTDVTVLIRGESGTGKELVARALHERSLRRDKPFVKVNCAALPTELLESELFGFERGAFTGAVQHKAGKFECANHGTIFLDEIGDMSPPLQAKLLQVLQDGEFSRLGGKADVQVDVRVVTATNRHLESAVAVGEFREDLYFRLNVVTIGLPPLHDRREEIPFLTDHFLKKYSAQYNKPATAMSAELAREFMQYDWPGNVRQLENLIKRMVVLGSETLILSELRRPAAAFSVRSPRAAEMPTPLGTATAAWAGGAASYAAVSSSTPHGREFSEAMPPRGSASPSSAVLAPVAAGAGTGAAAVPAGATSLKDIARTAAREAECALILRMLTRTRWNRKEAAEILGISYKALLYKIKENGLDKVS